VRLSPARLPRQAGGPVEKDFREWEYESNLTISTTKTHNLSFSALEGYSPPSAIPAVSISTICAKWDKVVLAASSKS
jgi:hypothetical protein